MDVCLGVILSDAHVRPLIVQLPQVAALDPDQRVCNFCHGWVEGALPEASDLDEVVSEHLVACLDNCDENRLR